MPRRKPETAGTTWEDLGRVWEAWEDEAGAGIKLEMRRSRRDGRVFVEVVLSSRGPVEGYQEEVYRERHPVTLERPAAVAGQVLHAVFLTLADYDANPWYWTREKRARAVPQA